MKRLVLVPAFALLSAVPAAAGPWPQALGTLFVKTGVSHLETRELATSDGTRIEIPTYSRQEIALYVQAPLSARWTAIVSVPVYRHSKIDGFESAGGPGDLELGLQTLLASRGDWRLAARLTIQAPTGDETKGQRVLPTGSGVWEEEALLSLGRTVSDGRGYGFVEAGYRARGSGFADALVYRAEAGVHVGARWLLAGRLAGFEPYSSRRSPIGSLSGLGDGVSYLTIGPGATLKVRAAWAIQAEADFPIEARTSAVGATFRLALLRSR